MSLDPSDPARPADAPASTTIDPLPSPPAPWTPPAPPPHVPVPGEMTPGWLSVLVIAWVGIILGFAAVWNSSVKLGLSTWWLGPESAPVPFPLHLIPFVLPLVVVIGGMRKLRYLPAVGVLAALVAAAVAAGDIDRVPGIAVIEFALAGAGLAVSGAAFSGLYRRERSATQN